MQTDNGRIWFQAGIDDSQLRRGVTAINRDFSSLQQGAGQTGNALSNMWQQAAVGLGAYLTAQQALQIGQNVVQLTAQRQLMEKTFEVMFGSVDMAQKKIEEFNEYAIFSPYTFDGVAKGAQTLSAFGVEVDDLMPTISMLGDVAGGNAQRFESLSLVFGQVTSAGRLMGQDLLQFINAGFNPLQIISEKTGQSMLELKKQMEAGAISADMVQEAFKIATSEGGKFYNMTAAMADGIEAASSTFQSAWVEKQIEWGKQNEDIIKSMYQFGTYLVENLDDIGRAFGVLVTAVGTYKAALIAMQAVQTFNNKLLKQAVIEKRLAAVANITLSNSEAIAAAKSRLFAAAQQGVVRALQATKVAIASNPIGLLVTVLTTAASAWYLFKDRTEEASEAMKSANTEIDNQQAKVQALQDTINNSNVAYTARREALVKLKDIVPEYNASLTEEGKLIDSNTEAIKKYIEQFEKQVLLRAAQADLEAAYIARREAEAEIEAEIAKGQRVASGFNVATESMTYTQVEYSEDEAEQMRKEYLAKFDRDIAKLNDEIAKRSISAAAVVDTGSPEVPPTLKEQLDNTVKEIARVQQLIADIRSGAVTPTGKEGEAIIPSAAITDLEGKLKGLKETRDTLLGYDPSKSAAAATKQLDVVKERISKEQDLQRQANLESYLDGVLTHQDEQIAREQIEQDTLDNLLAKYATYQQRRQALQKQYETNLAALYEGDGTTLKVGVSLGNVDNLTKEFENAVASLNVEAAKSSDLLVRMFSDPAKMAISDIQALREEGERLVAALSTGEYDSSFGLSAEQFEALKDQLPELRELLDKIRSESISAGHGIDQFNRAIEQMGEGLKNSDPESFAEGLKGLSSAVSQVTTLFGGLSDTADQVGSVINDTLGMAATGASVGGPIGAAVGAAIGLGSSLFGLASEAEARYKAALEAIEAAEKAYTTQSIALARERALSGEEYESILGIDAYGQAVNAVKVYNTEIKNLQNSLSGLSEVSIVTGFEKTGLFGWGKGRDVYSDILDVYPELIDAQGNFNAEIAQTILDTQTMGDESRATLEEMVATAEQAAAAYEQLGDYLNNIFGGIGSSITEQIAEGLRNGKFEVEDVLSSIGDSLESFIQDMAYSMFLGDMMQKASEDMLAIQSDSSLSDQDRLAQMSELMGGVMESASAAIGPMEEFFKMAQEQAAAAGIDIFKPDTATATQGQATAGEATTINQETGAAIDGKLNALLLTGSQTAANTGVLVMQGVTIQTGVLNIRDTMDVINVNVAGIYKQVKLIQINTEVLPAMAKDMAEVKKNTAKL